MGGRGSSGSPTPSRLGCSSRSRRPPAGPSWRPTPARPRPSRPAGPWAPKLLELDVVPARETVVYFRLDRDRPPPSVVAEIANGHGFYALHDPDHGLKVGRHKSGPPADPDEPGAPDEEIVRACVA